MGQSQSVPTQQVLSSSRSPRESTTARVNTAVRPPEGWQNDAAFNLVSPTSDISNPSQFRHRIRHNAQQAEPTRSSRRASKVISKPTPIRQHRSSSLPPPLRFTFAATEEDPQSSPTSSTTVAAGKNCTSVVISHNRWKQKCQTARRRTAALLGNCAKTAEVMFTTTEPNQQQQQQEIVVHRSTNQQARRNHRHQVFSDTTSAKHQESSLLGWTVSADVQAKRLSTETDQSTLPAPEAPYMQLLASQMAGSKADSKPSTQQNVTEESVLLAPSSTSSSSTTTHISQKKQAFDGIWKETQPHEHVLALKQPQQVYLHSPTDYVQRLTESSENSALSSAKQPTPSPVAQLFGTDATKKAAASSLGAGSSLLGGAGKSVRSSLHATTKQTTSFDPTKKSRPSHDAAKGGRSSYDAFSVPSRSAASGNAATAQDTRSMNQFYPRRSSSLSRTTSINSTPSSRRSSSLSRPVIAMSRRSSSLSGPSITESLTASTQKRRSMVQEQVQLQINEQTENSNEGKASVAGSRIARIRQQYQMELERLQQTAGQTSLVASEMPNTLVDRAPAERKQSSLSTTEHSKKSLVSKVDRMSLKNKTSVVSEVRLGSISVENKENSVSGLPPQARRMSADNKQSSLSEAPNRRISYDPRNLNRRSRSLTRDRFSSLEGRRSSVSYRVASSVSHRSSVSARPATALPGLLHLAGANSKPGPGLPTREPRPSTDLPALLHVAGWKKTGRTTVAALLPKDNMASTSSEHPTEEPALLKKEIETHLEPKLAAKQTKKEIKLHLEPKLPIKESKPKTAIQGSGTTTASILRETYTLSGKVSDPEKRGNGVESKNYREIALGYQTSLPQGLSVMSPDVSISSASTNGSKPMVSDQALSNAAFMFSPSYAGGNQRLLEAPRSSSEFPTSFAISTLGSRNRLNVPTAPVTIPQSSSMLSTDTDASSKSSTRRVRFSDAHNVISIHNSQQPTAVEIPVLESKLSDLTDGSLMASLTTNVESEEENATELTVARVSVESSDLDKLEGSHEPSSKAKEWVYRSMDSCVTPLRSGKSAMYATNSPYLRFREARSKFSSNAKSSAATQKELPVKKASPIRKRPVGSLVHSRIAAMETRQPVVATKTRRDTTGHKALAPKKSTLASPLFSSPTPHTIKAQEESSPFDEESVSEAPDSPFDEVDQQQSRHTRDEVVSSIEKRFSETSFSGDTALSISACGTAEEGDFGDIVHLTTLDEETIEDEDNQEILKGLLDTYKAVIVENESSDEEFSSDEDDDFHDLLHYNSSYDQSGSVDEETVETMLQDSGDRLGAQFSSYRISMGRRSTSSNAMTTGGSTVTTIRQPERKTYSGNALGGSSKLRLPFREEGPVKPNEQNHHSPPGGLRSATPTKRTPMQPRTWRALAAAAQERDSRRNLSQATAQNGKGW